MSRSTRPRLYLGRPEDFSKTALWRLYGGALPTRRRKRPKKTSEALVDRLADFMHNILARHW